MTNKSIVPVSIFFGLTVSVLIFIAMSFLVPEKKRSMLSEKKSSTLISFNLKKKEDSKKQNKMNKDVSHNLKNFILNENEFFIVNPNEKITENDFQEKEFSHDLDLLLKKTDASKEDFNISEKNALNHKIEPDIFEPSELDTMPLVLKSYNFEFPVEAKRMGIKKAKILLKLVVDERGNVKDAEVVSSTHEKIFNESALKTVKKWKFSAGLKRGKKVSTFVFLPVRYVYEN
ncbi:MAG: energy transducer TonB [Desulfobacteraceae bacterium]|nr:energy transducer TonB [Desulfobacteraceae bacterium]